MKKKYLIILLGLLILLSIVFLVYKTKQNSLGKTITSENITSLKEKGLLDKKPDNSLIKNTVNTTSTSFIKNINNKVSQKFSGVNLQQLNNFLEIAASKNIADCENLGDLENQCKYYVATYQKSSGLCGDISDKKIKFDCYLEIAPFGVEERIDECKKGSDSNNCLVGLFWAIEETESCDIFTNQEIKQLCSDTVNFNKSISSGPEKCALIKYQPLEEDCKKLFVAGDFDNDGLFDKEETKIGTNPYRADTDNDGFSDKDEFNGGYNPCGDGRLPTAIELFNACKKLY